MQSLGVREPHLRYDVFLSFRATDTRNKFTDHLYWALVRNGFHTFRDDEEIRTGKFIGLELEDAILESTLSVVILSRNYASSCWCLNELALIMEQRDMGHHVVPIFYDVKPSQVKRQTHEYAEAFAEHEKSFEGQGKVEAWRKALREVSELRGHVPGDRSEAIFIQDIVNDIRRILNLQAMHVPSYLVGREELLHKINQWVQNESHEVGIATIYGTGGVGKTTLAKAIFNSNYLKFEASSFLADIGETSQRLGGLIQLQMQLTSNLLKEREVKIWNMDEGMEKVRRALRSKKVLVVFDDVVDLDQLKALVGMKEWFSSGSRIIVTTRNQHVLMTPDTCHKFEIQGLSDDESIQLLSWHAFGQDHPAEGYIECSKRVVQHCSGLPLALEVIGSSLRGKSRDLWESELDELEVIPDNKIQRKLIVGYNCLPDADHRSVFLDICCFFIGVDAKYAAMILKGSGFPATKVIQNLIDRCIIYLDMRNRIKIHQLLKDLGSEIIRQEAIDNPGKRTRVWRAEDALKVLRGETGSDTLRGFSLDMRMLKNFQDQTHTNIGNASYSNSGDSLRSNKRRRLSYSLWKPMQIAKQFLFPVSNEEELRTNGFKAMSRLQLLKLYHVNVSGSYIDFPKGLVWLCWHEFPLESIPKEMCLANLVALELCYGQLKHTWKNGKILRQLKNLDLSHSYYLTRTPDLKGLPSLERLVLEYCINLGEIDDSIAYLEKLAFLRLRGCKNLRKVSSKIWGLRSLEELDLSDCSQVRDLSLDLRQMERIRILRLSGAPLGRSACPREDLGLRGRQSCYSLFPSRFFQSKISNPISIPMGLASNSLVELSLSNCSLSDEIMGVDFSGLISLEWLDISNNPFRKLPEGILSLQKLGYLSVERCSNLQSISVPPIRRKSRSYIAVEYCESLESLTFTLRSPPNVVIDEISPSFGGAPGAPELSRHEEERKLTILLNGSDEPSRTSSECETPDVHRIRSIDYEISWNTETTEVTWSFAKPTFPTEIISFSRSTGVELCMSALVCLRDGNHINCPKEVKGREQEATCRMYWSTYFSDIRRQLSEEGSENALDLYRSLFSLC